MFQDFGKRWGAFRSKHLPANWELLGVLLVVLATAPLLVFQNWPDVATSVAIVVYIVSVPVAFAMWQSWKKWSKKRTPHDRAITFLAVVFMISPVLSAVGLGGMVVWRAVSRPAFAVLAPAIGVNRTYRVGCAGPFREELDVDFWVLTSVGVCPNQLPYGFQVEGIRVRVEDGTYHPWVEYHGLLAAFPSPVIFNPGTCLEVQLLGGEREDYKQSFGIPYQICRSWRTYADIIQYLQLPHTGFEKLDWDRAQSMGLLVADHGAYRGDGTVDALYVRYADDRGDGPVFLDFSPCLRLEGNVYGFLTSPASRHIRLEVPEAGGQIVVRSWDSNEILMTCTTR